MGIADEYKNVTQNDGTIVRKYPTAYYPQLTNEDYIRGYIMRYFIKLKTNSNNTIIEIKEDSYKKYSATDVFSAGALFQSVSLRWKITGTRTDAIVGNTNTVENKETLMKNIGLRLSNRLEFWK